MLVLWVEKDMTSSVAMLSMEREYSLIIPFLSACSGGAQLTEIDVELITDAMRDWGGDEGAERQ